MNIKDINSRNLKAHLSCKRAAFRYHNKNKAGGNFGFELRKIGNENWELWGQYDKTGKLIFLRLHVLWNQNRGIDIDLSLENDSIYNLINKVTLGLA